MSWRLFLRVLVVRKRQTWIYLGVLLSVVCIFYTATSLGKDLLKVRSRSVLSSSGYLDSWFQADDTASVTSADGTTDGTRAETAELAGDKNVKAAAGDGIKRTAEDSRETVVFKREVRGSTTPAPPETTPAPHLEVIEQDYEMFMDNCTDIPRTQFKGSMTVNKKPVNGEDLKKRFPEMFDGRYIPGHCRPSEKTAIIIPFRNRHTHLYTLLPNLIPMLIKQGIDFTIFVVEQDLPTSFNKGVVFNAGYLEALKVGNFDCFILHDVDLIPLNDLNFYRCESRGPVHFTAGVNKFQYGLLYPWLLGGVLGFTREQYKEVNGFSNLYFGWGAEDDDMSERLKTLGVEVYRRPKSVGLYDMIVHKKDKRWGVNKGRIEIFKSASKRTKTDGLNSVRYKLTAMKKQELFIHVRISVDMDEVYETAPSYMKDAIQKAKQSDIENRLGDGTAEEVGYNSSQLHPPSKASLSSGRLSKQLLPSTVGEEMATQ